MERSVAEEEARQQTESTDLASNSSVSLVNIDSMVVDITIPVMKNETGDSGHFSIRGYVLEMREKNRKMCDPFAPGRNQDHLEQLPPLIVPKNRCWRCASGVFSKCWQSGPVPHDVPSVIMPSSTGDAAVTPPEMQQTPPEMQQTAATAISSQMEIHIDASPPMINFTMGAASSSRSKEIRADTGEMVITGLEICAPSSSRGKGMSADNGDMFFTGDDHPNGPTEPSVEQPDTGKRVKLGSGNIKNQKDGVDILYKSSSSIEESSHYAGSLQPNCNELVQTTDQDMSGADHPDIQPPIELNKCMDGVSAENFGSQKLDSAENEREVVQASDSYTNNPTNESIGVGAVHSARAPSTQEEDRGNDSSDSEETLDICSGRRQYNGPSNGLPRRKTRKVRLLTDLLSGKDNLERDRVRKDDTSSKLMATTSSGSGSVLARESPAPPSHEDLRKGKQSHPPKRKTSHLGESRSLEIKGIAKVTKKVRSSRICSERPHKTSEVAKESEDSHQSKRKNNMPLSSSKVKASIQVNSDCGGNKAAVVASDRPVVVMDTSNVASKEETEKRLNLDKGKRAIVENENTSLSPGNDNSFGEVPSQTNQAESRRSVSDRIQSPPENDASTKVCLDLSLGRPPSSEGIAKDNVYKTYPMHLQQNDRLGGHPVLKNIDVGQVRVSNNSSPSLPVRKEFMWDRDGRTVHSSGSTLEKQNNFALSQKRGFTMQEKVNANVKNKESRGLIEASRRQNDERASKAFEKGYSDDIPMEIVELMAKNQFERQMAGEGHSLSKRTDCLMGGSASVIGNHSINWMHTQTPGSFNMSYTNATNGIAAAFDNRATTGGKAINFSISSSENRQKLSNGVQYPLSNCGSHPNKGATPSWLSKDKNIQFGVGIPQKFTALSDNIESHARSTEMQQKGITVSDIRALELERQEKWKQMLSNAGGGEVYPKPVGSLDPYANETIPAMHLLSLMNKGMSSNAAFDAEGNRYLPSSRCDYHPGFSLDASHNVVNKPFALYPHQGPGESSRRPSSSFTGQMSFKSPNSDEANKWASPVPLRVAYSEKSLARSHDYGGGIVISEQPSSRKVKQNRDKQIGVRGTSNSLQILPRYDRLEISPRFIDLQDNNVSGTSVPSKEILEDQHCSFNQNPADFSIPEPGNKYTISGRDLKPLRNEFYQGRSYSVNVDGRKRQRPAKVSTGKKQGRPRVS